MMTTSGGQEVFLDGKGIRSIDYGPLFPNFKTMFLQSQ
jgi:hypothetical protein